MARLLAARGSRIVAISDSSATLRSEAGLDIPAIAACEAEGQKLADLGGLGRAHVLALERLARAIAARAGHSPLASARCHRPPYSSRFIDSPGWV